MNDYIRLDETTFTQLYNATIKAFPKTKYRQNDIYSIKVRNVKFVPYQGLNTLFISSLTENIEKNTEYKTIALIKNINYHKLNNPIKIFDEYGKTILLEKPQIKKNDVLIRCNCKDFMWRFNFYNSKDNSLYGRTRKKYESKSSLSVNPSKSIGVCKHLMKLFEHLLSKRVIEGK